MRSTRFALALAGLLAVSACGEREQHANRERPAAPINVTAAIIDGHINVSPRRFGAGPIRMFVTNQTSTSQTITFATDEVGGDEPGLTRTTAPIKPAATATLRADVRAGDYRVSAADDQIQPVAVKVGAPRPSAQGELLQP
jgi:hypothetical protein